MEIMYSVISVCTRVECSPLSQADFHKEVQFINSPLVGDLKNFVIVL